MNERTQKILSARAEGQTYTEIAQRFGVSKQRVGQICGKQDARYFQYVSETGCVYPYWREWMNENMVSRRELVRRMGLVEPDPGNAIVVGGYMRGEYDPPKRFIDRLIEVTGLKYEVLFYKGDK